MARERKLVRAGHRLGGGAGGCEGERRRTNDEAGIRAVELQPDFKTIQTCLVENVKDIYKLDGHKMFEYKDYICNKTRTGVVHRRPKGCPQKRQDERNRTSDGAPNELTLGEGG